MNKDVVYIVCIILILFMVMCIADVHWSRKHVKGGNLLMGLWKQCGENLVGMSERDKDTECVHLPPEGVVNFPKNSLYACRALTMLGLAFLLGALGCLLYKESPSKLCVATMFGMAGLCILVAGVVWVTELLKLKMPDGSTLKMKPCYAYYINMMVGLVALFLAGYVSFAR